MFTVYLIKVFGVGMLAFALALIKCCGVAINVRETLLQNVVRKNLLVKIRHVIWVVGVSGARTSSGHEETSDKSNNQGADDGGGHGHRQLLGRVVRPVDRRQARDQGKAVAAGTLVDAVRLTPGDGVLVLNRVFTALCVFIVICLKNNQLVSGSVD
jgi:hypothetical protein